MHNQAFVCNASAPQLLTLNNMVCTANKPQWKVVVKYFLISLKYFSFVSQLFLYFFIILRAPPGFGSARIILALLHRKMMLSDGLMMCEAHTCESRPSHARVFLNVMLRLLLSPWNMLQFNSSANITSYFVVHIH